MARPSSGERLDLVAERDARGDAPRFGAILGGQPVAVAVDRDPELR